MNPTKSAYNRGRVIWQSVYRTEKRAVLEHYYVTAQGWGLACTLKSQIQKSSSELGSDRVKSSAAGQQAMLPDSSSLLKTGVEYDREKSDEQTYIQNTESGPTTRAGSITGQPSIRRLLVLQQHIPTLLFLTLHNAPVDGRTIVPCTKGTTSVDISNSGNLPNHSICAAWFQLLLGSIQCNYPPPTLQKALISHWSQ